jgi:hypothetical protein
MGDTAEGSWGSRELGGYIRREESRQAHTMVSELTYMNYAHNRNISPEITPERWEKVYGPRTPEMELRYQNEKVAQT